jgi:hypothetical protein
MSIYVSICCVEFDDSLITTINSCFDTASNPDEVYVGVAMIGDELFFEKISNYFGDKKNLQLSFFPFENNFGIGKGRNLAASLYSGQDYFLQIDAHSLFNQDWDTNLVSTFIHAQGHVRNDKVILTGYLPEFMYDDKGNIYNEDRVLSFSKWTHDSFMMDHEVIPRWFTDDPRNISSYLSNLVYITGLAPAPKVSAAFMFGNKELASNLHLPENLLFWEEELIQTIELISDGFTLVYPFIQAPITHLYHHTIFNQEHKQGFRPKWTDSLFRIPMSIEDAFDLIKNNFLDFIKDPDNFEKIEKFQNYANIDLLTGYPIFNNFEIKYSNSEI